MKSQQTITQQADQTIRYQNQMQKIHDKNHNFKAEKDSDLIKLKALTQIWSPALLPDEIEWNEYPKMRTGK